MSELITAISTGFTAFTATNLDDIVMLLLFFSQVNAVFRHRHIVAGQYLGFSALVIVSLPSFFGSLILPEAWIGLLGIVPILIGVNRLLVQDTEESESVENAGESNNAWLTKFLSPQTYSVAAVTFANGSDNIGVYVPLFASSTWENLLVILAVFFSLVGVWCYVAYRLTCIQAIAHSLTHYGNHLVPFVLIGLGVSILLESHTLENSGSAIMTAILASCFCLQAVVKNSERFSAYAAFVGSSFEKN